jgi:hypothetical protein
MIVNAIEFVSFTVILCDSDQYSTCSDFVHQLVRSSKLVMASNIIVELFGRTVISIQIQQTTGATPANNIIPDFKNQWSHSIF